MGVTQQQLEVRIAFGLRVLPDHHHIGARASDCGREIVVVDHADDRHVRLRCDDVVDDVEHQCGHFRQEDTNPLQGFALKGLT